MSDLLPCPFCGGAKIHTFGPYGWYRQWGISHSCQSFYSGTSEMMQGFHTEAAAVEAWNTRAPVAIEARRAKTGTGLVHESAGLKGTGQKQSETPA